jgi:NAD(P)-dependent dehydrogenase (short-subunit alcohol dehydrogenase family)
LEGSGVTANALHPGFVATGFGRNNGGIMGALMPLAQWFAIKPEKGAETSVFLATSPEVANISGKYFASSKEKQSSQASYVVADQDRLWALSEQLVQPAATPA